MSDDSKVPIIMQKFSGLQNIPWMNLTNLPTPVEELVGLEKHLNFKGIFIKRDDITNPFYGGNKPRKYEYVFADAIKKNRKNILTIGAIGTNHGLAQTILAKKISEANPNLNLQSYVFLIKQPLTEHVRKNLLLDLHYGAKLSYHHNYFTLILSLIWKYITMRKSYFVWPGAGRPLGTIGFVNAIFELKEQILKNIMPEPDFIFVPVGTTGTAAGLLLGCELNQLKTQVYGVQVVAGFSANSKNVVNLAYKTYKLMKKYDASIPSISKAALTKRFKLLTEFFGGQYGMPTEEGKEAIDLIKKSDNIILEHTYTGKTMAGLIAFVREHKNSIQGKTILYWNTLNSIRHDEEIKDLDYHNLPKKLHKFFDGTIALETRLVKARKI